MYSKTFMTLLAAEQWPQSCVANLTLCPSSLSIIFCIGIFFSVNDWAGCNQTWLECFLTGQWFKTQNFEFLFEVWYW
jgi:hypothetical protein